jgi:chemotaxis protein histidine kinase CheA
MFMTRTRRKIHALGLIGLAALAGCATVPPPIQLMDHAQAEIRAARDAGAAKSAPETLAAAERRLAAAQQFSANDDNGKATDKAQEAEAAAATARARAEEARLGQQIRQQTAVNESLKADLQRRQAAAAAAQQAALAPAPAATSVTPASNASAGQVTLPSIRLGQPSTPAPSSSAAMPAPGTTAGQPDSGVNP